MSNSRVVSDFLNLYEVEAEKLFALDANERGMQHILRTKKMIVEDMSNFLISMRFGVAPTTRPQSEVDVTGQVIGYTSHVAITAEGNGKTKAITISKIPTQTYCVPLLRGKDESNEPK